MKRWLKTYSHGACKLLNIPSKVRYNPSISDMEKAVVGTGDGRMRGLLRRRGAVAAVGAVAAIIVVVGGSLLAWHVVSTRPRANAEVTAALNASQSAYNKGAFTASLGALKGAADRTTYNPQKVQVYDQLAMTSAAAGKLQDAVHYYTLKHQLDPTTADKDADALGQIYERLNDKQNAVKQYTIALNYYKSLPNAAQLHMDIATLQGQIDSLKGGGQ